MKMIFYFGDDIHWKLCLHNKPKSTPCVFILDGPLFVDFTCKGSCYGNTEIFQGVSNIEFIFDLTKMNFFLIQRKISNVTNERTRVHYVFYERGLCSKVEHIEL